MAGDFEAVYVGCCIGCISGAGWTGSYLAVVVAIIGAPGGPFFGPPLFPLGGPMLYSAGCFVPFLILILSTSILTNPAAPGGGGGPPPPPPVCIAMSAISAATVGVACGLFSCTSLCLFSAMLLLCSSKNNNISV